MGIEKLWTKTRSERAIDPEIQAALDAERVRVKESLKRLGSQTKESCTAIAYNTLVRPFAKMRQNKGDRAYLEETIKGGADSTAKLTVLVGRVLLSTGRVAKYGVRKAAQI